MGPTWWGESPRSRNLGIYVDDGWRRRGLATRLLRSLRESVEEVSLQIGVGIAADRTEARFLEAMGFDVVRSYSEVECPTAAAREVVMAHQHRLRARGSAPADWRVAALAREHSCELTRACAEHVMQWHGYASIADRLRRDWCPQLSRTLHDGRGSLLGAILCRREGSDVAWVDIRFVHEEARGGWANNILMHSVCEALLESNVTRLRFAFDSRHGKNTAILAERSGAIELRREHWYAWECNPR